MAIRYGLRLADGGDAGTFETNLSDWQPGMELRGHGNVLYRITAIIPADVYDDFDDEYAGLIEVEPIP
jgi:hypothetical protein